MKKSLTVVLVFLILCCGLMGCGLGESKFKTEWVMPEIISIVTPEPANKPNDVEYNESMEMDISTEIVSDNTLADVGLEQYRCVIIGDSIVWYDGNLAQTETQEQIKGYTSYLKEAGMGEVETLGECGACIAYHDNGIKDIVSLASHVDYSGYDIVIITGGVNDYKFQHSPLGSLDSEIDDTTYTGALCKMVEEIQSANPSALIMLCTPLQCGDCNVPNNQGLTLGDYANRTIEVANKYGVCVVNLYNYTFFNENLKELTMDELHPNNVGFERISTQVLIPAIRSNIGQ